MPHYRRNHEFIDQHNRHRPLRIGEGNTVSESAELDHHDHRQVENNGSTALVEIEYQESNERA